MKPLFRLKLVPRDRAGYPATRTYIMRSFDISDGLLIGKEVNPDGSENLATEWIEPETSVRVETLVDHY